jgi:hypothetical protein
VTPERITYLSAYALGLAYSTEPDDELVRQLRDAAAGDAHVLLAARDALPATPDGPHHRRRAASVLTQAAGDDVLAPA